MRKIAVWILAVVIAFSVIACLGTYEDSPSNSSEATSTQTTSESTVQSETSSESFTSSKTTVTSSKAQSTSSKNTSSTVSKNSQSSVTTTPSKPTNTDALVWVPTNGGKKYHSKSSCSNMKNPRQVTKQTAINEGFGPCGRCY